MEFKLLDKLATVKAKNLNASQVITHIKFLFSFVQEKLSDILILDSQIHHYSQLFAIQTVQDSHVLLRHYEDLVVS